MIVEVFNLFLIEFYLNRIVSNEDGLVFEFLFENNVFLLVDDEDHDGEGDAH
jgi:hypothetical protein